jgi:hypothetical protein
MPASLVLGLLLDTVEAVGGTVVAAGMEDVLLGDVATAAEAVVAEGTALVVVAGAVVAVAAACGSQAFESASAVLTRHPGDQASSIVFASVARLSVSLPRPHRRMPPELGNAHDPGR